MQRKITIRNINYKWVLHLYTFSNYDFIKLIFGEIYILLLVILMYFKVSLFQKMF